MSRSAPSSLDDVRLKVVVSTVAFAFVGLHLANPKARVDGVTVALLGVALLPWLTRIIESAELPGGWKIQFRQLEARQEEQAAEIATLRFLVSNFVSPHELRHIEAIDGQEPFVFRGDDTTKFFEAELRRLRQLGLIASRPGKGVRTLFGEGGDVRDHFCVTDVGKEYLRLRSEVLSDSSDGEPS